MKYRNPLFVAGFPYAMMLIGYFVIIVLNPSTDNGRLSDSILFPFFGAIAIMLIGAFYTLYWQISTARELRRTTDEHIPLAILLIIPFANYWWQWRYSQAAEKYTKGKLQGVLAFILLFALGSIGMGIIQDFYNKTPGNQAEPTETTN